MKKLIPIVLILIFIITGCSKTENATTEENLPVPIEEEVVNTEENIPKEVNSIPTTENINIKEIKIYSPVYTLTWETLPGTTKVEVIFSGSTKKDAYLLKQFKVWDKNFITNLRLDFWNIEKWENNYEIKFYNQKDEIIGSEKYLINVEFEEINVWENTLYISNIFENMDYIAYEDYVDYISVPWYEKWVPKMFLYKNNNLKYSVLSEKFYYSKKDWVIVDEIPMPLEWPPPDITRKITIAGKIILRWWICFQPNTDELEKLPKDRDGRHYFNYFCFSGYDQAINKLWLKKENLPPIINMEDEYKIWEANIIISDYYIFSLGTDWSDGAKLEEVLEKKIYNTPMSSN